MVQVGTALITVLFLQPCHALPDSILRDKCPKVHREGPSALEGKKQVRNAVKAIVRFDSHYLRSDRSICCLDPGLTKAFSISFTFNALSELFVTPSLAQ